VFGTLNKRAADTPAPRWGEVLHFDCPFYI
jgi:hypothetical protein